MKEVIKFDFECFDTVVAFLNADELRWLLCALIEYAQEGADWEDQYEEQDDEAYRKVRLAFYFMKEKVQMEGF